MSLCLYNYDNDPLLRHEVTLEELVADIGLDGVFDGTDVDTATRTAIADFFMLDRLCDTKKQFLWVWRRNLNLYYPIYKEQADMWAERKTRTWFFDNFKDETRQHDGTFKLDETTKAELLRELSSAVKDIFASKIHSEGDESAASVHTGSADASETDAYTNGSTGKNRTFSFNYPESNYQGGVLPYELSNNPNVEFINAQSDGLSKSDDTHNGSDSRESHDESDDKTTREFATDGTTDNTDDRKTEENSVDNSTGEHAQQTETHWTERVNRQGDNLNQLAAELIAQIPATNFFKELIGHLKPCFQQTYLVDELIEEIE